MLKKLVPLCLIFSSAFCINTVSIDKLCKRIKDDSPIARIQELLTFEATNARGIRIKNEKLVNLFSKIAHNGETNPTLKEQFAQTHSDIEIYLLTHFKDQKLRKALTFCLINLSKIRPFYNA